MTISQLLSERRLKSETFFSNNIQHTQFKWSVEQGTISGIWILRFYDIN